MSGLRPRMLRFRPRMLVLVATVIICGLIIGYIDSRPGFDDTAITAGLLFLVAAIAAAIDGRRPWFWALLAGLWVPVLEIPPSGRTDALAAFLFTASGALAGATIARIVRSSAGADPGTGAEAR